MIMRVQQIVYLVAALMVIIAIASGPVAAQNQAGMSQAGTGSNPTAQAISEQKLLQELDRIQGRITIPDRKAAVLQQPEGRDYRAFHERTLPWIAGLFILGMLLLLAVFYLVRGRIRMDVRSGVKILRFNVLERFTHWMTATAFIVLAITGVNYVFGKRLLMPLIGADAFARWSHWAKLAHNFVAWPFMLGVLIMIVVWLRDNIPDRYDAGWLRAGGGFFNNAHPPAARFNAGQKLIFWSVVIGGLAVSASGLMLLFPFSFADIAGMQIAQYVHATAAVVLIAIILAHIYIGSLGMEGAYEAMGTGEVDLAWAKAHHSAWVEEEEISSTRARPTATPAE
jgi:formate dehydrogenase subunit gamma